MIFLIFTIFLVNFRQSSAQCLWNLNTDLPDNDPIYLYPGATNLIMPASNGFSLLQGQTITLLCAGSSNKLTGIGLQEINATCSNNKLIYNGNSYALNALNCTSTSSSDIVLTGTSCANGVGEMFQIGFTSTKGLSALMNVCYNRVADTTLYSTHLLPGTALSAAEIDSTRPSFRVTGLTSTTAVSDQYKQTSQTTTFTNLLGATQAAKYINTTSYLARGHLAPDADFVFGTWSYATYFLVNAAPEWQVVNAGNWLEVEDMTRAIATQRKENLIVYTGIHDVLELPNSSGTNVKMYLLSGNRLRVPKYYWKIIHSPPSGQGIALITLNNPHATSISPTDIICPNICATTGWNKPQWTVLTKGYTFCCDVNTLISVIGTMSPLTVTAPMQGPV